METIRSLTTLLAVAFLVLGGCVGGPQPEPTTSIGTAAPGPTGNATVRAFDATGGLIDLPSGLGIPFYAETGFNGPEPSIGITKAGNLFFAANWNLLRSKDRGVTWEKVVDVPAPDRLPGGAADIYIDPWATVDGVTNRIFHAPMAVFTCTDILMSDDEGETFARASPGCQSPPIDHQKLVMGKVPAKALPIAGKAYATIGYLCYNKGYATNCLISYDGGQTWPLDSIVARGEERGDGQGGGCINGKPAVSPTGVIALPMSTLCKAVKVGVSEDGGTSWKVGKLAANASGAAHDGAAAYDRNGTLYQVWNGGEDYLPKLMRSRDNAATWEGPWTLSPPDIRAAAFQTITAGDPGRVAVAFLGTRDANGSSAKVGPETRWHLFITTSENLDVDEPSFVTYQVTPEDDPVQVGTIWDNNGIPPDRNLQDFIESAEAPDGTFFVAYTEGCPAKTCASKPDPKPDDSRGLIGAIARLDGWSLKVAG